MHRGEEAEAIARVAVGIRAAWKPGRSCRLPVRAAWTRVERIARLVERGMIEPSRVLAAARAAARAARR